MKTRLLLSILVVLALGSGVAYYLFDYSGNHGHTLDEPHSHRDGEHAETPGAKGPHGGRLLRDGDFTLELTLQERAAASAFRAWFTQSGAPTSPSEVKLTLELTRPGGAIETFTFVPDGASARSTTTVDEPHSFDYSIVAEHAGRTHRWQFSAPEMQTTMTPEAAQRAGVVTETAGPAIIAETLPVYGQIKINANAVARAVPRFGGVVREARKFVGDSVVADEVVAIVETNQSLVTLEVKAPISGTIIDRPFNAGETVTDGAPLYTIANFSNVWVDLNVARADQSRVQVGQTVTIHADGGRSDVSATISWIAPVSSAEAQSLIARVVLDNSSQQWRPGLFVKAEVVIAEERVPVAVKESALQTLADSTVVFSQHRNVYQARPLQLGRRGSGYVEVLGGLGAGESYVTTNSFLLKADIGKAGAAHTH